MTTTKLDITKLNHKGGIRKKQMQFFIEALREFKGEVVILEEYGDYKTVYFGLVGVYGIFAEMYGNTVEKIHTVQANTTKIGDEWVYYYYIGPTKYIIPQSINLCC
jgi:hypothetical protein